MSDRRQQSEEFIKERRKAERREHQRKSVSIAMELTSGNDLYFHVSANLSEGGAFFDRALPHRPGTQVQLTFQLPGPDPAPVRCQGEVVNVNADGGEIKGLGMGVRFSGLSATDEKRVAEYVAKLSDPDPAGQ